MGQLVGIRAVRIRVRVQFRVRVRARLRVRIRVRGLLPAWDCPIVFTFTPSPTDG
jgi:hypothetical protein